LVGIDNIVDWGKFGHGVNSDTIRNRVISE